MRQLAILSHIVLDEIHPADGGPSWTEVGGAGAYAAVGASLADRSDGVVLVSGVGRRDRDLLDRWCCDRGVDSGGLFEVGESSPRTVVRYDAGGERTETPRYGLEHFGAHTPLPEHIPASADDLTAIYLFHDHDPAYWGAVRRFPRSRSVPVMWEISRDSCDPARRDTVFDLLSEVDVLSLNRSEVLALTGRDRVEDAVHDLAGHDVLVLLRMGERGSLVVDGASTAHIGIVEVDAVDPTGGGNSCSGAFLAELASSGDPIAAARMGAAAASAVVSTPGAPVVDDALRRRIRDLATIVTVTTS